MRQNLAPLLAAAALGLVISSGCGDDARSPTQPSVPIALTITSVLPNSGSAAGGTQVRILGTGFRSGARLTFGGTQVNTVFVNSTSLAATTQPHAPGPVDIVVTNPDGGLSELAGAYTYAFDPGQIREIVVSGNVALTFLGETSQLTAIATFADGTTRDVTGEGRWLSTFPAVATINSDGVLTARGLGATTVGLQYPSTAPSRFGFVTATVTPAGTFAVSGRIREPGAGGVVGARVVHVSSGQSVTSGTDGYYSMGALTGTYRFAVSKDGYEDLEIDLTPTGFVDIALQRIVRHEAGAQPLTGALAPNDLEYIVAGGSTCQPCRLIRVTSSTPGTVQIKLTWPVQTGALRLWANGQMFVAEGNARELIAHLPIGSAELVVFIGTPKSGAATGRDYLSFTIHATMTP